MPPRRTGKRPKAKVKSQRRQTAVDTTGYEPDWAPDPSAFNRPWCSDPWPDRSQAKNMSREALAAHAERLHRLSREWMLPYWRRPFPKLAQRPEDMIFAPADPRGMRAERRAERAYRLMTGVKNKDPYCYRWFDPKDIDDDEFSPYWVDGVRPTPPEPTDGPLDNTDDRPSILMWPECIRPDGSEDSDRMWKSAYATAKLPQRIRRESSPEAIYSGRYPGKAWLTTP